MARSQLDQIAGVGDVGQFSHFHKVLLRRAAAWSNEKGRQATLQRRKEKIHFSVDGDLSSHDLHKALGKFLNVCAEKKTRLNQ